MSKLREQFHGYNNRMKTLLHVNKITVDELYKKYCDGADAWYSRPHLNRIINGKRSIPIVLAQDIAKTYKLNWTDFYEVPLDFIKTIDCVPSDTDDLSIKFDAQPQQFHCVPAFTKTHWACASLKDHKNYFGNATKAVYLIQKYANKPTQENIASSQNMPICFKTKCGRYWMGRLINFSTPLGKKEPTVVISDTAGQRSYPFPLSYITDVHFIDYVCARPTWLTT